MGDINEMKNLIIQSFESKGVLSQLRSQIRASVFKAVEEDGARIQEGAEGVFDWENRKALDIRKDKESLFIAKLIQDFVKFYDLEYSANIIGYESGLNELKNFEVLGSLISRRIWI